MYQWWYHGIADGINGIGAKSDGIGGIGGGISGGIDGGICGIRGGIGAIGGFGSDIGSGMDGIGCIGVVLVVSMMVSFASVVISLVSGGICIF